MANALDITKKLITYPSLTPTHPDTRPRHVRACTEVLDYIQSVTEPYTFLSRRHVFSGGSEKYPQPVDNLWLSWKNTWLTQVPRRLLYIGHADVVPVNRSNWTSNPFRPRIANGRLYGRGATDMKGPLACFLAAMNNCVANNRLLDVEAIITTDEEWAAINGVKPMLDFIKNEHGIWYDAVLVGEPSSLGHFGNFIATGRRGSLNVRFTVTGKAGHCAYRNSYLNPVDVVLPLGMALQTMVFRSSPEWLAQTELVVRHVTTDSPSTSMVASVAHVFCNIRYTGNYTPEELMAQLSALAQNFTTDGITVTVEASGDSNPYLGIPQEGRGPELLDALQTALIRHNGQAATVTHEGGTSDGRKVKEVIGDVEIVEFGPDTTPMHADDESIALDDLDNLQQVLEDAIPAFCGGNTRHATAA